MKRVLKWLGLAVLALLVVFIVLKLVWFDFTTMQSWDMWPTVGNDSLMVVNRRRAPRRGDLILYQDKDGKPMVRRVVALPGEKVAIIDSRPYVDGLKVEWQQLRSFKKDGREYLVMRETLGGASYEVLDDTIRRTNNIAEKPVEGGYYVLADHREHALDSRAYGPVPRDKVRGVVSWIVTRGDVP